MEGECAKEVAAAGGGQLPGKWDWSYLSVCTEERGSLGELESLGCSASRQLASHSVALSLSLLTCDNRIQQGQLSREGGGFGRNKGAPG